MKTSVTLAGSVRAGSVSTGDIFTGISGKNTCICCCITFFAAAAVTVCHTLYALSGRCIANAGGTAAGYSPVFTGCSFAFAADFGFAVWTLAASADTGLAAGADVGVVAAGFGSAAVAV